MIENAGIERVVIRSVLTCEIDFGVCAHCYGRDLARGEMVNLGEAVGVIAAQSIGEPGTQLTMRTFHIGGTATRRVEASHVEATAEGEVRFNNLRTVNDREGRQIAMNRNGEIGVFDASGRERERYPIVYGAQVRVADGARVKPGDVLVEWDPFANPILAEMGGTVKFGDIVEGDTMREQVDEFTGLSSQGDHRVEGPRAAAAHLDQGQRGHHDRPRAAAGRREPRRDRGPGGRGRRRAREDAARDRQDEGHHRRSAARGGALRGAQAEGLRDRLGDRRHRLVRSGLARQAARDRDARPRTRSRRST